MAEAHDAQSPEAGEASSPPGSGTAKAVLLGFVGALAGAAIWGAVVLATGWQADWLALVVGVATGVLVRLSGCRSRSDGPTVAVGWTVAGIFVGNLLMLSILAAEKSTASFGQVLRDLPVEGISLLALGFQPLDVVWYAAAIVLAGLLAYRRL